MDGVRAMAVALYNNGTPKFRAAVSDLFRSMDADGSGTISKKEFTNFLDKKCPGVFNPEFFSLLDADGNGTLNFTEAITFIYYCGYRGIACDGCRSFIFGGYFTCACCFVESKRNSYDICIDCFKKKNYEHEHAQFQDNYSMLHELKELKAEQEGTGGSKTETSDRSKSKKKRKALAAVLTVTGVASVAVCTIM